jgi:ADP-ribose pyrophosphatase YjhB (NUDIX family)
MIVDAAGHAQLNYRAAGVCVHDGHVLLHRAESEEIWALPGGRPALFETSRDALVREMHEEIGLRVEVGRLLWVMEHFFAYAGRHFHELGFYYLMMLPKRSIQRDVHRAFIGHEGEIALIFRWFPVGALTELPVYPIFLRRALADLPGSPVHIVHSEFRDEDDLAL